MNCLEDFFGQILLSNIAGIFSFTVLLKIIKDIIARYKYKRFNGYWILMIHNGNIEYIKLLYLHEDLAKKIKIGKIPTKDKNKIPSCVESAGSAGFTYKNIGIRLDSNLVLDLHQEAYSGYASLSSPSNENTINSEYCYWSGKFLPTKWKGNIFNGSSCEISLTKITDIEDIEEVIRNSKAGQIMCYKEELSKYIALSIIVTAYNNENTVEKCLKSIINDNNSEFMEVIIVNDGSFDRTNEIINRCIVGVKNVKVIKTLHRGINFSRNVGLSVAKGQYLMFVDAADALMDGIVDNLISLTKLNMDIVIGGCYEMTELGLARHIVNSEMVGEYSEIKFATNRKKLQELQLGSACGKLYKNALIRQLECKFEENYYGDTWFNIEIQKSMPKVYVDEKVWYYFDSRFRLFDKNEMSMVEYLGAQFNVLLRYIDTMNSLPINKKIREKCVKEYNDDVKKRVAGKIRKRGRRAL